MTTADAHHDSARALPDEASVSRVLDRILASSGFVRAERLSALLRFIVSHTLQSGGARLKSFTIAREVFGRDETFDPATDSVVRVEVGRLRRRLEAYSHTTGRGDDLVIEIPKGSYVAAFRPRAPSSEAGPAAGPAQTLPPGSTPRPRPRPRRRNAAAIIGILAVAGVILSLWWPRQVEMAPPPAARLPDPPPVTFVERIAAEAPLDQETAELYRQAVALIFAPQERARLLAARRLLGRVSERAPGFAGGYAGESFTHSLAVIFGSSKSAYEDVDAALRLATTAVDRNSNSSFGHAMLGLALVLGGEEEQGIRHSRLALAIQPNDALSHWVLGVNLLLLGRPEEAVAPASEALRLDRVAPRMPYRNVLGIAYLASGDPERAVEVFESNQRRGGPDGAHMSVLRAVAYAELDRDEEARAEIDRLNLADRTFPVVQWLSTWLRPEADLRRATENLRRLGLPLDAR